MGIMKLKTLLLVAVAALTLSACGSTETETASSDANPLFTEGEHDASAKENTHQDDLTAAKEAEAGSTKTLSGKYKIEGTQNTFYVVEEDKLSLVESGTYEFGDDGITIQYGNNSPVTYEVTEVQTGFNLTSGENILLPLEYMEGTDGLTGTEPFDGVYGVVNDGPGYVFYSNGTIDVVTTHEAEVTDKKIEFGGLTYTWKAKKGKILFYDGDSKEPAITMVPVEE